MKTLYRQGKLSALQSLRDLGVLKKKGGYIENWKESPNRGLEVHLQKKHTWKKGRNNSMEEKNIVDIKEELEEVLNIMQLLEISLTNNEDDEHIIRSLHVLQRMVKSVMDKV
mgnify:CR=1 FL=1